MTHLRSVLLVLAAVLVPNATAAAHHVEMPGEVQWLMGTAPSLPAPEGDWTPEAAADDDAENMTLLANLGLLKWSPGSDLAFQRNLAVAGNYGGGPSAHPGGLKLIDIANPAKPELVSDFKCPGPQADVSVWGDLAFLSVDSARSAEGCTITQGDKEVFTPAASTPDFVTGKAYEGIRIVSIADPKNPRQIKFVDTDCGSHTHTLVPDLGNGRLLIYVLSYPLGAQAVDCSVASHRKFSIVEVPLADPTQAKVIATPSTGQTIGCHDVTVFLPRMLAGAACLTNSQIWDISDPAAPKTIATIPHPPGMQISHSSQFSWDGNKLVLGDEKGGAIVAAGCTDAHHAPLGALWFYDVTDATKPVLKGSFRIPETRYSTPCTAHNFNAIPFRNSDRDVLTASWYHGGTQLIEFTDPAKPEQLGHYIANGQAPTDMRSTSWSSYFYNGHVYANNFENGYPVDATARGFDSMAVAPELLPPTVHLSRLNPQTQIAWPPATG